MLGAALAVAAAAQGDHFSGRPPSRPMRLASIDRRQDEAASSFGDSGHRLFPRLLVRLRLNSPVSHSLDA